MARTKQPETTITTYEQADQRLAQLREVNRKLLEVQNVKEREMHALEQRIAAMRIDPETGIDYDVQRKAIEADLLAFTESRRSEFTERRSRELPNGILGFRLGTGRVTTLSRITQKAIQANAEWMKQLRSWGWTKRPPEQINKGAILDAWRHAGEDGQPKHRTILDRLAKCGLTVEQKDEPFVEPAQAEIHSVAEDNLQAVA